MTDELPPKSRPRRHPAVMILGGAVGLVAMFFGVKQIIQGVGEMSGGVDKEASVILKSVNGLVAQGNKESAENAALFDQIAKEIDSGGLAAVRSTRASDGKKVEEALNRSAAAFRGAADKCAEGTRLGVKQFMKDYLGAKAEAYRQMAANKDATREMVQAMFDPAIGDTNALLAKLAPLRKKADDAAAKSAQDAAKAEEIAKAHPENLK